jgi:hypothetical protein
VLARELGPGRGRLVQTGRIRAGAGSAASELAKPMVYTFGRRTVLRLRNAATQCETCWQRPVARAPYRPGTTRTGGSGAHAPKTASTFLSNWCWRAAPLAPSSPLGTTPPPHAGSAGSAAIAVPGISENHRGCTRRFTRAAHTRADDPERATILTRP